MKALKIILCLSVINLAALFLIVLRLPATIPVHLDINMAVDRYGSRWTVFIFGLAPPAFAVIMLIQQRFTRDKTQTQNKKVLTVFIPLIASFLIFITWLPVLIALQYGSSATVPLKIPIDFIIMFPIGILITVLSNYMGLIKRNAWMGLRVYWTISDETVWKKTHRLCGFTGVIGGILICVFSSAGFLLKSKNLTIIGFIAGMVLFIAIPTVYSYLLYRKLNP